MRVTDNDKNGFIIHSYSKDVKKPTETIAHNNELVQSDTEPQPQPV